MSTLPNRLLRPCCALLATALCATGAQAATLTVTTTSPLSAVDGHCSIREAILALNAGADFRNCTGSFYGSNDRIEFDIPGEGLQSIVLATELPTIIVPVTIDGLSQPGASCATWPPTLRIELDGQGTLRSGLALQGGDSLVRGLVIGGMAADSTNFSSGLALHSDGNRVECNYIGMRADGSTANPNRRGIDISSGDDNIIGTDGTQPALGRRNLVSGNIYSGINTRGNAPSRNLIGGNYIGVDASGTAARTNRLGIHVGGSSASENPALDNVIGYSGAGDASPVFARNIISGNGGASPAAGIDMTVNVQRTRIAGNYIGLSADGSTAVPNRTGISIGSNASVQDNIIGFPSAQPLAESGNVISGNSFVGISLNGANGTDRTFIVGNLIGTFPDGSPGLPNGSYGVSLYGDTRALVSGNVISGHELGIRLLGTSGALVPTFLHDEALPTGGGLLDSTGNCITDNDAGLGLNAQGGTGRSISFDGNWWGAADGPSGAGSGNGDSISSGVGYQPFLTTAPQGCAVTPVADLSMQVSGVPDPVVAGSSFIASFIVHNNGPNAVDNALLRIAVPDEIPFLVPPICSMDAGQVVCPLGPIASGADATGSMPFSVPADAAGTFSTTVSATSAVLDPAAGNNSVVVARDVVHVHDVRVVLGTQDVPIYGNGPAAFQLRVDNLGPSHANGTAFELVLPDTAHDLLWTCTASGGATCAAAGADTLDGTLDLPAGSAAVFEASIIVGAVATVPLQAFAIEPLDGTDPAPSNNMAALTLQVSPPREPEVFRDGFEPLL